MLVFLAQASVEGAVTVTLAPDQLQPQPVGTTINWTATALSTGSGPVWYRFSVRDSTRSRYIAQDFSASATFSWTPSEFEDTYEIEATAMDLGSGERGQNAASYEITPLVTAGSAMANQVGNPLVAYYNAPACAEGAAMQVRFQQAGSAASLVTAPKTCTGKSMNFYVAGLYPNTDYLMAHEVVAGSEVVSAPALTFHTGGSTCNVPRMEFNTIGLMPGSLSQGVVLWSPIQNAGEPYATDLYGNVIWCFEQTTGYLTTPIAGGEFFILFTNGTDISQNRLAIIDLAGNIVQQTNVPRMNQELAAAGFHPITEFHHDARQLPNGDILTIGSSERILTDVQGPGNVDVIGDIILVLDANMQLKWAWDSFAHLDTSRKAVLGETCASGGAAGCPPVLLAPIANDWLHGNAVSLAPDGNIIYSSRHQDFVYKIDYENGHGTGNVIWKLGPGGDFTTDSTEFFPWNSHQHDATYAPNGLMTIFDNGNTRRGLLDASAQSRGQVLSIDETNHRVHYVMNEQLGVFSYALGSAQLLEDGNYHFGAGYVLGGVSLSQIADFTPEGKRVYQVRSPEYTYRTFRMNTLYELTNSAASSATSATVATQNSASVSGQSGHADEATPVAEGNSNSSAQSAAGTGGDEASSERAQNPAGSSRAFAETTIPVGGVTGAEVPEKVLQSYAGTYAVEPAGEQEYVVTLEQGQLEIEFPGGTESRLIPVSETKFSISGASDLWIQFAPDKDGVVDQLIVQERSGEVRARRRAD